MNTIKTSPTRVALAFAAVAAVLILSACGGSDSSAGTQAQDGSNDAQTVSVTTVDGVGEVLVDAEGAALYAADQEAGGMVLCTDSCATIWDPLAVSGGTPTAGDGLGGKLDVVTRPDGARQVTFDGRLLYRFVEDPSPGTVTGNGLSDTFDGRLFTWHVATPTGVSTSNANSAPSSDPYDF
jgi:predicted lipoprotein with Yx(FWY)xxD motif